jgi:D-alanine-D-alanine ligase
VKKPLAILVVFDYPNAAPADGWESVLADDGWRCEKNVTGALRELGHDVRILGLRDSIEPLLGEIRERRPDIVFNLVEAFAEDRKNEANVAGLLELLGVPYTGSRPACLTICRNKAFTKRILTPHRIKLPGSIVLVRGQMPKTLKPLRFPVFVKPLGLEGSDGIAQSSFTETPEACLERVRFLHESLETDALIEEYIEGREFYSAVLGNDRLRVLPLREMVFDNFPEERPRFATFKAKWDESFRKRWGIKNTFAAPIPDSLARRIATISKTAYRALDLKGYGRVDLRVTPEGEVYLLEVNPNPNLAMDDEVAEAAKKASIAYGQLIGQVLASGLALARPAARGN